MSIRKKAARALDKAARKSPDSIANTVIGPIRSHLSNEPCTCGQSDCPEKPKR